MKKPLLPNAAWLRAKGVFAFSREGDHPAFRAVAVAAKVHKAPSQPLRKPLKVFKKGDVVLLRCSGYTHGRMTFPAKCPGSEHTVAFFEVVEEVV